MAHLRDRAPLDEPYLVGLQNVVISDPMRAEHAFRGHQNWLQRGGQGALAVRYVPLPPEALQRLVDGFMRIGTGRLAPRGDRRDRGDRGRASARRRKPATDLLRAWPRRAAQR